MTKITDYQRAVLEAAAQSSNLVAWPTPAKLKLNAGAATIVIKGLLKKELLMERPALGVDAVWREDEEGCQLTVVITKAGLAAVEMMADAKGQEGEGATVKDEESPKRAPQPATRPQRRQYRARARHRGPDRNSPR